MKKLLSFLSVVAVTLIGGVAIAGSTEVLNLINLGFPTEQAVQMDKQYSSAVTASTIPNANNSINLGSASKQFANAFLGTSVTLGSSAKAAFGAGAQEVFPVVGVITPNTTFPTPVAAGTVTPGYELGEQFYAVATAAPTAAFVQLPSATPAPGRIFRGVWNRGANPVAIVAQGSDTINNLAAATLYTCATGKVCTCQLSSTASNGPWICVSQ